MRSAVTFLGYVWYTAIPFCDTASLLFNLLCQSDENELDSCLSTLFDSNKHALGDLQHLHAAPHGD